VGAAPNAQAASARQAPVGANPSGCERPPYSHVPFHHVMNAAFDHLVRWVKDGTPPPGAPPIELTSIAPAVAARDRFGNALGGIRLAEHAVATAVNTGVNSGPGFCRLYGSHEPFDPPTLASLYPSHQAYVGAVRDVSARNVKTGYIVELDAAETIARAERSDIGRVATGQARVTIDAGELHGRIADGVASYLGIPYAAPPVGPLRWKAPQRAARWSGVRAADTYGASCMQHRNTQTESEDCLFMNVWTPASVPTASSGASAGKPAAGGGLPVMFWIHGGGLTYGSASGATYNGTGFAKQGLVLVSINYRLARFGFFAHPALSAEDPQAVLGNYGFMDQIAALQWVQRNIAAFGGNPRDVTIFGESAGGRSVNALLVSPLSKGLFHKAIIQSGAGRGRMRHLRESRPDAGESAEAMGVAFAKSAGLENVDAASLRALPAEVVRGPKGEDPVFPNAIIDGRLVLEDFVDTYEKKAQHRVPLLLGANSLEAAVVGNTPLNGNVAVIERLGSYKARALELYDGYGTRDDKMIALEMTGDMGTVNGTRHTARLIANAGTPVFLYHFSYVSQARRQADPAARHAAELAYVFNTLGAQSADADRAVARQMHAYWANFAKTGNPNGAGLPRWPAYSPATDELLEFSMNDGPIARARFEAAKLDFWDAMYNSGFRFQRVSR
jgi:para-nitrobenzyl esterase